MNCPQDVGVVDVSSSQRSRCSYEKAAPHILAKSSIIKAIAVPLYLLSKLIEP